MNTNVVAESTVQYEAPVVEVMEVMVEQGFHATGSTDGFN